MSAYSPIELTACCTSLMVMPAGKCAVKVAAGGTGMTSEQSVKSLELKPMTESTPMMNWKSPCSFT